MVKLNTKMQLTSKMRLLSFLVGRETKYGDARCSGAEHKSRSIQCLWRSRNKYKYLRVLKREFSLNFVINKSQTNLEKNETQTLETLGIYELLPAKRSVSLLGILATGACEKSTDSMRTHTHTHTHTQEEEKHSWKAAFYATNKIFLSLTYSKKKTDVMLVLTGVFFCLQVAREFLFKLLNNRQCASPEVRMILIVWLNL